MLANIENKSLLRLLVAGSCSAILTVAGLTMESSAGTLSTTSTTSLSGNCLYSEQLRSDPALRAAFTAKTLNGPQEADNSDLYESDIKAGSNDSDRSNSRPEVDSFSNDCLGCHDGVMATAFKVRVKNNPQGRVMTLEDIIGGHPVGMHYETYVTAKGDTYKSTAGLSKEMIFADGKIGCLTCHNPLNEKKGHLVMNNDNSSLCFACHSK